MRGRGLKRIHRRKLKNRILSPPMRGRGLKHKYRESLKEYYRSPPMRGRGLKPIGTLKMLADVGSPPMRGRGLKPCFEIYHSDQHLVAPHAGAWIETPYKSNYHKYKSPPMRGRGLKPFFKPPYLVVNRRPPCGGVD